MPIGIYNRKNQRRSVRVGDKIGRFIIQSVYGMNFKQAFTTPPLNRSQYRKGYNGTNSTRS